MNTDETISTFTEFFRDRGHQPIGSSSLLSRPGDPVLFTSAGMHPLTPYLAGQPHPLGRRLTGVQRCLRTTDLDEVGDYSHLTVFQMLGSWSLGDYGGPQSLRWGLELLCDGFGLKRELLYATVFGGDEQVGPDIAGAADLERARAARRAARPRGQLVVERADRPVRAGLGDPRLDRGRAAVGEPEHRRPLAGAVEPRHDALRAAPGRQPDSARQPSVDTGMGLERLLMVTQHARSVYETDLFTPWLSVLPSLWRTDRRSLRILSDHLRSAIVVIGDGVRPSNTGRGYVLRRLLRRALTALWRGEGGSSLSLSDLPPDLVQHTAARFGQVIESSLVTDVLAAEERKFRELVSRGRSLLRRLYPSGRLTEEDYEFLRDTHGLPQELVTELLGEPAPPSC